ncbi:9543_t:CDS:2, partial [Dentiscutata heterogama]
TCTGVKHFMFLDNLIKNSNHTEVDMSKDLIQENDESLLLQKTKEAKTYTYSPPSPERVPKEIMHKLKTMIEIANNDLIDISPKKLISSNLIKATFETNYLSEIHASLNNIDKLKQLVSKVQKEHNPYRQSILGLTYNIWKEKKEYDNYVQQAGVFADRQIMVICISKLQAETWKSLEYFEIDIVFKCVQENINKLEINIIMKIIKL